jgi:hypothetical protein
LFPLNAALLKLMLYLLALQQAYAFTAICTVHFFSMSKCKLLSNLEVLWLVSQGELPEFVRILLFSWTFNNSFPTRKPRMLFQLQKLCNIKLGEKIMNDE